MIKKEFSLDFQWQTADPFLFCAFHRDYYPKGNAQFGPAESLAGRSLGQDFEIKNGYRMYHGSTVPGFPTHPHRGFETVTIVRKGFVDHADSLGAAGRYGEGDVQWMTAGAGIQHSEMFPLLKSTGENPLELFQIWLNLPKANKMVEPHFKMFWHENIPIVEADGATVQVIAGDFKGTQALAPPPNSWAHDPDHGVALWFISLQSNATLELPTADSDFTRTLYFYEGEELAVADRKIREMTAVEVDTTQPLHLHAQKGNARILVMQGRVIGEPVVQRGPFVMNTNDEIMQTIRDYQQTRFGGWPWKGDEVVHGLKRSRFAKYPDGREERPT